MKQTMAILALAAALLFPGAGAAQQRMPRPGMGERPERIEKFRMMRLVEILKLSEEDAVRFYAKQRAHEEKIGALMKERGSALDDAEKAADGKGAEGEIQKATEKVLDLDQQIFGERQRFQKEMRQFLTPAQFVTFLGFERRFGMQVRDALGKMRRQGSPQGRR